MIQKEKKLYSLYGGSHHLFTIYSTKKNKGEISIANSLIGKRLGLIHDPKREEII